MRFQKMMAAVLFGIATTILFANPSQAKRIALVIGNDGYLNVDKLQKAVNDANAVAETLTDLNFTVIKEIDVDRSEMNRLLGRIAAEIEVGDEVLFYFSGHGVSVSGQNYLLPIDIPKIVPSLEHSLSKEAFSEDEIIRLIQKKGARVSVLIIDACRNNPFPKQGTRAVGRSVGLERAAAPKGTFIIYSAGLEQQALDRLGNDDKNPNSVFTRKLLPLMKKTGLEIANLAKGLRVEVEDLALSAKPPHQNHKQFPAYYDQLRGKFYFLPPVKGQVKKADPCIVWPQIAKVATEAQVGVFLDNCKSGIFADLATARMKELRIKQNKKMDEAKKKQDALPTKIDVQNAKEIDKSKADIPEKKETKVAIGIYSKKQTLSRNYKPGNTFKDCDDCPEMVVVPPGSFMMGSPKTEEKREENEGPRHKVTIAKKFAVGKFEVTRQQFETFVKETKYDMKKECGKHDGNEWTFDNKNSYENPGFLQTERHPVVCVSWMDSFKYLLWLSAKTGNKYRFLSESEWEYVSRANSVSPFWWGNSIFTNQANYFGYFTYNGSKGLTRNQTVSIDSFKPNKFGLYNVHGNVAEWVEDCWKDNYRGVPKDGKAWTIYNCPTRVSRGGGWTDLPEDLRSAYRNYQVVWLGFNSIGFRVARSL